MIVAEYGIIFCVKKHPTLDAGCFSLFTLIQKNYFLNVVLPEAWRSSHASPMRAAVASSAAFR